MFDPYMIFVVVLFSGDGVGRAGRSADCGGASGPRLLQDPQLLRWVCSPLPRRQVETHLANCMPRLPYWLGCVRQLLSAHLGLSGLHRANSYEPTTLYWLCRYVCEWQIMEQHFWLTWKMYVYVVISAGPAGCPTGQTIVWHDKIFAIANFSDTINVINVKFCVLVLLLELFLFIPFHWPWPYLKVTEVSTVFTENFMLLSD